MNPELLVALRNAEAVAWKAIGPASDSAENAHQAIASALRLAEGLSAGPRCEAPGCEVAIEYSGIGRHRRFCSDKCRKASHRATRHH